MVAPDRDLRDSILPICITGWPAMPTWSRSGCCSFAAIAQLAPAFFIGLFWRRANARGAMAGMTIGIAIWPTR